MIHFIHLTTKCTLGLVRPFIVDTLSRVKQSISGAVMHKFVVVTGGASGLGKALAIKWAQSGANVCIADINEELGNSCVDEINATGGSAFFHPCDVTKVKQIQALKSELVARWSQVDLVINNAGVATADRLEDEAISQWQWVFEINLFALVKVSQIFTPLFKSQGHGYFVNVASQAGITPIPYMSSYNTSKAAVVSLSETMRLELADDNIGVSVLCPGFFKTNLGSSLRTKLSGMKTMLDRVFEKAEITAEQVAEQTYNAVSKEAFYIVTHKEGKKIFQLKQLLPMRWYLNMVLKQTANLRKRISADDQ